MSPISCTPPRLSLELSSAALYQLEPSTSDAFRDSTEQQAATSAISSAAESLAQAASGSAPLITGSTGFSRAPSPGITRSTRPPPLGLTTRSEPASPSSTSPSLKTPYTPSPNLTTASVASAHPSPLSHARRSSAGTFGSGTPRSPHRQSTTSRHRRTTSSPSLYSTETTESPPRYGSPHEPAGSDGRTGSGSSERPASDRLPPSAGTPLDRKVHEECEEVAGRGPPPPYHSERLNRPLDVEGQFGGDSGNLDLGSESGSGLMMTTSPFAEHATLAHVTAALDRSMSVDSGVSSIAASDTTASALLPLLPRSSSLTRGSIPAPLRIQPRLQASPSQPVISRRADLSAEQKSQLLRRARKLERVLGEPLNEEHVERYVVEPSLATTTVTTSVEQDNWPSTPTSAKPEFLREDCVPRRVQSLSSSSETSHQRRSTLERVKDLFLGSPAAPKEMLVTVTRETKVVETTDHNANAQPKLGVNRAPLDSPALSSADSSPSTVDDPEEVARRARRQQLAKLQRLLGHPVPPHAVPLRTLDEENLVPTCTPPITRQRTLSAASVSPSESRRWTARLRPGLTLAPTVEPLIFHSGERERDTMTPEEKQIARKRASKLEQVFGATPPQSMFLPSVTGRQSSEAGSPSVRVSRTQSLSRRFGSLSANPTHALGSQSFSSAANRSEHRTASTSARISTESARDSSVGHDPDNEDVFTAYRQSLTGLIFLVEHDQSRLASIVDELDAVLPASPTHSIPMHSPVPPPRAALRALSLRRTSSPIPASALENLPTSPRTPRSPSFAFTASRPTSPSPLSPASPTQAFSAPPSPLWPPSPLSPRTLSPHGLQARRARKLSQFFGATPVFHSVPDCPLPGPQVRRRETLDGVLREMWRSVQSEVSGGGIRERDAARLREMMATLRKIRGGTAWAELD